MSLKHINQYLKLFFLKYIALYILSITTVVKKHIYVAQCSFCEYINESDYQFIRQIMGRSVLKLLDTVACNPNHPTLIE